MSGSDSIEKNLEKNQKIQEAFLDFLENEENIDEKFINLQLIFEETKIKDCQQDLKLFFRLLLNISNNHHREPNFFSKIDRVLHLFKDDLKQYKNKEIFNLFKSNKRILLFLIEEKIMTVDEYFVKQITKGKYLREKYPQYFTPEIKPFVNEEWFPKHEQNDYSFEDDNNFEEEQSFNEDHSHEDDNNFEEDDNHEEEQSFNEDHSHEDDNNFEEDDNHEEEQSFNEDHSHEDDNNFEEDDNHEEEHSSSEDDNHEDNNNSEEDDNHEEEHSSSEDDSHEDNNNSEEDGSNEEYHSSNEYFSHSDDHSLEEDYNHHCDYMYEKDNMIEEVNNEIPENFYELRNIGENDSYLCKLIREDLVLDFIAHVNKSCIPRDATINFAIYETNQFLLEKQIRPEEGVTLIEYAAFFGSIQIFTFLKNERVKLTPSLWYYAIHGKNAELIHLLEENRIEPNYKSNFKESIKCHHNDIANYFINNYLQAKDENSENTIIQILKCYNFSFLTKECINESFNELCKYDYYSLVKAFLTSNDVDINKKAILTQFFQSHLSISLNGILI